MVVMVKPATKEIIDKLAGILDFYEWHPNVEDSRTIPICRKWPHYRPEAYSEESKIMQPFFAYSSKMGQYMSPQVRTAYYGLTIGSGLTIRDYITRCYLARQNL
jgi:hypothetical protein